VVFEKFFLIPARLPSTFHSTISVPALHLLIAARPYLSGSRSYFLKTLKLAPNHFHHSPITLLGGNQDSSFRPIAIQRQESPVGPFSWMPSGILVAFHFSFSFPNPLKEFPLLNFSGLHAPVF